ncbi:DUF1826 domain-containing protein [Lacimicrobium alkaliphilum]|uniref:Succinylglutamate desuccinylase n=1 Tax=Lacimicrobium alkaliphilum TaxID=1526571 RepID=A0A0U3B0S4_9ALTE|nr:DUF1826 domain-containing protein [Lacimicrobium alkaliphilum]ALS99999.1 hypothetical protein AT746_18165 [Lacimicrobium alkaliphilum]
MSMQIGSLSPCYQRSSCAEVLSAIFARDTNLCVWQRALPDNLQNYVSILQSQTQYLNLTRQVSAQSVTTLLSPCLPEAEGKAAFIEDIRLLTEMLICLFDCQYAGLRLRLLDGAMCPRFHTDKLICRMLCSYNTLGTQWLGNAAIDRSKLGHGSGGLDDAHSGLYSDTTAVCNATAGDVLLLKGEAWPDNEGGGVVHRSPAVPDGTKRLLLTLDPM